MRNAGQKQTVPVEPVFAYAVHTADAAEGLPGAVANSNGTKSSTVS
jgi:hypothetical protein